MAIAYLFSLVSCEQKIDTWSGTNVAYIKMATDSTVVSFAYLDENIDTVYLGIAIMGNISEKTKRYINVKLQEKDAIVGEDYDALAEQYEVKNNATGCIIPVVIRRPADETNKEIIIELVENSDFHLYYKEDVLTSGSDIIFQKTKHRIIFNNIMKDPPDTWNIYYLGNFSARKFATICDVMQIPRSSFLSPAYMGFGRLNYIANYMKAYLDENPVMDGDAEMRMGDFLYQ